MKKTILVTIWTTVAVNFVLSLINPFFLGFVLAVFVWYRSGVRAKLIAKEYIENDPKDSYTNIRLEQRILEEHTFCGFLLLGEACRLTDRCLLKEMLPSILYKAIPSFRSPFKN